MKKKKKETIIEQVKKKTKKPLEFHFFFSLLTVCYSLYRNAGCRLSSYCGSLARIVSFAVNIQMNASVSVRLSDVAANYSTFLRRRMNRVIILKKAGL